MNFSVGIIAIVGILVAISIGFIAMNPDDVIQPRMVSVEEKPTACTMEWSPMCGVDGETYGNLCMLKAAGVKLDHDGECSIDIPLVKPEPIQISVNSYIMPKTAIVGESLIIEVEFRDDEKNIVDHVNYDIFVTQDGTAILSEPDSHRHPGMHPIHETSVLGESEVEIKVIIQGIGHGDEITEPKGIETIITVSPEFSLEPEPTMTALPMATGIHTVNIAEGSGTPGCEETLECYLPYSITISVGDTVKWDNPDSAAHTVTSGNISDGHDGLFDSSLFMSGSTFEFTFDEPGKYDYFCMVHPWMTGEVIVNDVEEMVVIEEPESMAEPTPEPITESSSMSNAIVSVPAGSAVPGCEETLECYLPYEVTVNVGQTVTWNNDDSAAHTVTSGSVDAGLTGIFDSGLFMSGSTFEFTFDEPGKYDYFCMVHPWMTGIVNVN